MQRSRTYFVRRIAVFMLPILVVGVVLELVMLQLNDSYKYKHSYIEQSGSDIQTIILGNSHAYFGIDPSVMPGNAFNLANLGQSLRLNRDVLLHYEDQLDGLDLVVLNVSYNTMYGDTSDSPWRAPFYAHKMNISSNATDLNYLEGSSLLLSLGLKPVYKTLVSYFFLEESYIHCDSLGQGTFTQPGSEEKLRNTGLKAATRHGSSNGESGVSEAMIREVLEACRQKNVRCLLVMMPASSFYLEHLDPDRVQKIEERLMALAQEYNNVQVRNYLDYPALADSLYFDGDHLTREGARRYTEMMVEDLKEY